MATKQRIMYAALDRFSKSGYEATSINQIASTIGIKAPSIYKHFPGKQAIVDAIRKEMLSRYEKHSIMAQPDWSDEEGIRRRFENANVESMTEDIVRQISYSIHDPYISNFRKLITIEQFRDPEIAAIQSQRSFTDILNYTEKLFEFFMREGIMEPGDARILAFQFISPFSTTIFLCDREPFREEEAMDMLRRHIKEFCAHYMHFKKNK